MTSQSLGGAGEGGGLACAEATGALVAGDAPESPAAPAAADEASFEQAARSAAHPTDRISVTIRR